MKLYLWSKQHLAHKSSLSKCFGGNAIVCSVFISILIMRYCSCYNPDVTGCTLGELMRCKWPCQIIDIRACNTKEKKKSFLAKDLIPLVRTRSKLLFDPDATHQSESDQM